MDGEVVALSTMEGATKKYFLLEKHWKYFRFLQWIACPVVRTKANQLKRMKTWQIVLQISVWQCLFNGLTTGGFYLVFQDANYSFMEVVSVVIDSVSETVTDKFTLVASSMVFIICQFVVTWRSITMVEELNDTVNCFDPISDYLKDCPLHDRLIAKCINWFLW